MNTVIGFVKNPILGQVKSRLAKDVGREEALHIYCRLLLHTREVLRNTPDIRPVIYYAAYIDKDDIWSDLLCEKALQSGDDLGSRMSHAFYAESVHSDKMIIIGSDCAQLTPHHITKAFVALEKVDVVIGPSMDGGYYLLGAKRHLPDLFKNIEWSTSTVLEKTLEIIKFSGLSYTTLDVLSDIDTGEDWKKYGIG